MWAGKTRWVAMLLLAVASAVVASSVGAFAIHQIRTERAANDCAYTCVTSTLDMFDALQDWQRLHGSELLSRRAYPETFQALVSEGLLKSLPPNPFGSGELRELGQEDPDQIGGFRYYPVYVDYEMDDDTQIREVYDYFFLLYTPVSPYTRQPWQGRVGKVPTYVETAPQGYGYDLEAVNKSERIKLLEAHIKHARVESYDEALTRLGYK